jgi:aconitate hydratase
VLELDLGTVVPSVAGPRRPQDRVELRGVKQSFRSTLVDVFKKESARAPRRGWIAGAPSARAVGAPQTAVATGKHDEAATAEHLKATTRKRRRAVAAMDDQWVKLTHGDVVIAAITSCTNTSNPSVMIAAGLLAKKAVEKG